VIMFRTADKLF